MAIKEKLMDLGKEIGSKGKDLGSKATDLAKQGAGKAGEKVEQGKITLKIKDKQKDIAKIYAEIGELVYENAKNGAEYSVDIKSLIEKIEECEKEIEALEAAKSEPAGDLAEELEELKEDVSEFAESVKEKFEDAKEFVEDKFEDAKEFVEDKIEDLKDGE